MNYIKAFAKLHPEWHIAVLSSIPEKNPYDIPDNVDFIDFYEIVSGLNEFERDFLLSRLIIQTRVKRLHIIHNEFCYRWVKKHSKIVARKDVKVYLSQFMYEFNEDDRLKIGFADPYISDIYPLVTYIFTDNEKVISDMHKVNGFSLDKMHVHYQPLELNCKSYKKKTDTDGKTHILWASRLSKQKRPDILRKIAEKLDPERYEIDVYGRMQAPFNTNYFKGVKSIKYMGSYNGIKSLDVSKYDIFLYTSQTDGLPNILLEIMALGLPIIASNVGGVCDLIKENETGYLAEGYRARIRNHGHSCFLW